MILHRSESGTTEITLPMAKALLRLWKMEKLARTSATSRVNLRLVDGWFGGSSFWLNKATRDALVARDLIEVNFMAEIRFTDLGHEVVRRLEEDGY